MTLVKTPYYQYDVKLLHHTLDALQAAIPDHRYRIHYAIKANNNARILGMISSRGLGADCVSGGEILNARACGFNMSNTFFAGVGKTDEDIELGLAVGIGCFNVESVEELVVINDIAKRMGKVAPVALRVNPNIDAHTHKYITTGTDENKFGIPVESLDGVVDRAIRMDGIKLNGLHFHIGSQLTELSPYKRLCECVNEIQDRFEQRGVAFELINVGGGLGVDYFSPESNPLPDFESYFDVFVNNLRLRDHQLLHFELGRSIVAQCGRLITKVLYVKQGLKRNFVIVDAGMTDLIRPALYGAHHHITNLSAAADTPREVYDVVGPICESADAFGRDIRLPLTMRGDLLAIHTAGAYGEVMVSHYNSRPFPGVVFVNERPI